MNKKLLIILLLGITMSGLITKLFAISNDANASTELKQREIFFTGAKLIFSMPENFSSDFPAEDLVTQVNLKDPTFKTRTSHLLLRRWWDFTEKSFLFDKQMGTIMMSITTHYSETSFSNRLDLIKIIHKKLDAEYTESNKTTSSHFQIAYPETYESFKEKLYNEHRWLSYIIAPMNASQATLTFVAPLTTQHYLEISFTLLPSSKINTREFEDNISREFLDNIMNSVFLKYENKAFQKELGLDINAIDIDDLLLEKQE